MHGKKMRGKRLQETVWLVAPNVFKVIMAYTSTSLVDIIHRGAKFSGETQCTRRRWENLEDQCKDLKLSFWYCLQSELPKSDRQKLHMFILEAADEINRKSP
ncbi:hypothetical protein PoB_003393400 [Plakobranchus ocellatus]|uniref:Uncharacterized protein n=1 Tax=Plakobranchus ocellatus TaxID=259542 RepID=A0AAV4AIB2_9GAST|nr:hypothetical protein PoB_003393400 [Plakobranchus ocellatus]